jgi:hypothetical protein
MDRFQVMSRCRRNCRPLAQNASGSAQQLQLALANAHEVVSGPARNRTDEEQSPFQQQP